MRLLLISGWLLSAIGVFAFALLSWITHTSLFPKSLSAGDTTYIIEKKVLAQSIEYEMRREDSNKLVQTFSGSTDLLCDEPVLLLYDVDLDGYKDLYLAECGGHQYYRFEGKNSPELVELGQYESRPDSLDSWYFAHLKAGFGREKVYAVLAILIGGIVLASRHFFRVRKKKKGKS